MDAFEKSAQRAAKVFLIEDDESIREGLSEALEDVGLSVSCAENGRIALDRLRAGPSPDVIILDLMMPVMDGWQFREEQLTDVRLKSIPTVIITAVLFEQRHIEERLGKVVYVPKPFTPRELIDVIDRLRTLH